MAIYHRDGFQCVHCYSKKNLSLHHVRRDGGNAPTNLVTLCQECNQREETAPCSGCNAVLFPRYTKAAVDRKEGLRLAKEKWPARYAQEAKRWQKEKNEG